MTVQRMHRPMDRSAARQKIGVMYFRLRRHLLWLFGGIKFARKSDERLGYVQFSHQTPLLRHLRGIDIGLEHNKITNLHIALKKVDGVVLRPGEVFSLWKLIGKPTRRKGYLEGVVLRKGAFSSGIGGGLCHLSGFIYWMTLHTPLTITERHRHGYDTTPDKFFGSDATCFYNYKDLMIANNTSRPFQLQLVVGENELSGAWLSDAEPAHVYELYEKQSAVHLEDWGGHTRHNIIHRRLYDLEGNVVGDEFVAENHAIMMYAPQEQN